MKLSDRFVPTCVVRSMLRLAAIGLLATACGDKKDAEEPKKPSGDVSTVDTGVKDKDPAGEADIKSVSAGGDDDPDDGGDPTPTGPTQITPPNLDLPSAAGQEKVRRHVTEANAAIRADNPDKALREAKLALAIDPNSIDAVAVMAHAYYKKGLYDTAEVVLDLVLSEKKALAMQNANFYFTFGLVYQETSRDKKARAAYEAAIKVDPNHKAALTNLGTYQLGNKQYNAALATYEKLANQLKVNTPIIWNNLGSAYRGIAAGYQGAQEATWLRKAEQAYKQALILNRQYAPAYYNLGLLYLDAKAFPGMDNVSRLERSKTYLDEYRTKPGADQDLVNAQNKIVKKLLKRARRDAKRKTQGGGA